MGTMKNNGIAMYLRVSLSDGDLGVEQKDESNSIENQRLLLTEYLKANDSIQGQVLEYVDDGYTGTNFNRPGFIRMIEDAKKGIVKVILVKDLSRLGRDYIVAGDYIEQIFPMLGVRFIAVNNYYDSFDHGSDAMGFDVAINNLINTFYSRDLSKRQITAKQIRWQQGLSVSGTAPFGYLPDPERKGKWILDGEAAQIVRLIFEKALEGRSTKSIALRLNEMGVPTPGIYNKKKKLWGLNGMVAPDPEQLWNTTKVRNIIRRYEYTGAFAGGKTKVMTVGSKSVRKRPENEWIVTENAHPAIVNHEEFYRANDVIQKTGKPDFKLSYDYPLKGKVRCGNCKRMLHYEANGYEATLYCGNSRQAGKHSQCCKATYSVRRIDTVVMKYLDRMFGILEWVSDQTEIYYPTEAADSLAAQISKLERDIEILKAEKLRQYESYAEGIISKEEYLRKKERIAEKVKTAEQAIAEKDSTLQGDRAVTQSVEALMETSSQFEKEPRLTQELSDIYVDTVYVYDTERVEVVLNNEDVIRGIIDRIQSKAGKR